jgi:hypothetical protein
MLRAFIAATNNEDANQRCDRDIRPNDGSQHSEQCHDSELSNSYVFVGPFAFHTSQHSDADCDCYFQGNWSRREMCWFRLHFLSILATI